ncbi:MAG TPA: NRAMP family divalent metal transporter [Acidimicrobiales bacterium]|nr:NRAMP family divalent metal transporter [Acidimicrobiales bacterium]
MADEAFDTEHATAVLDEAHLGDIHGAFGKISQHDTGARRSWRARLLTLAAILGPGIIVMVADNDAGGVSTYSAAGQNYGYSLLWTLPLLIPVLVVNQEMVVRLGSVTGVGHAKLIAERFGRFWAAFSVGDLFILNFATIVTEFIGVSLSLGYFGVSDYISVPIAALTLVALTASGSFRRWERFMFVFVFANFLVIPLAILAHPSASKSAEHFFVPGVQGGFNSTAVLLIIAIVGTTVAPWQLFFQQSNIVDKRITPRWINYERADTVIGSFVAVFAATLILVTVAAAFGGTPLAGHFTNAADVAHGLATYLGHGAGAMYAIILLNASIIGAASVTLSTTYAFGDMFGARHSLHRSLGEAKFFYASFAAIVLLAGAIVLIPHAPLGLITTAVQALAGILLPSATVFLLLLCNDKAVLGPWVNKPWLNILAGLIVSVLFVLSLILMVTTVFPDIDVVRLFEVLAGAMLVGFVVASILYWRAVATRPVVTEMPRERKMSWRMPPIAVLAPPRPSRARTLTLWVMWGYLAVAVVILLVKALQLGGAI